MSISEEVILNEERTSEEDKMKIIEGESLMSRRCVISVSHERDISIIFGDRL